MKPTLTLILILFALSVEAQAPIQASRLTIVNDSTRVDVGHELQEAQKEIEAIKEYDKKILTNLKSIRADLEAMERIGEKPNTVPDNTLIYTLLVFTGAAIGFVFGVGFMKMIQKV